MTSLTKQLELRATEIIHSHGAFGECEKYKKVNTEKLIEEVVKDCILQLQLKIVRNGDSPENRRSWGHIDDLASRYGIDVENI